jgi:hypothetical protein
MINNMHIPRILLFISVLVVLASCGNRKKAVTGSASGKGSSSFELPQIPSVITEREEMFRFLSVHYWDHFNFCDTTEQNRNAVAGKVFLDYLNLLTQVPADVSKAGIDTLMSRAQADNLMLRCFEELAEKHLNDPNSPLRNETLYIQVLKYVLSSSKLPPEYKIRPADQYKLACRNRPGEKATDFSYTQCSGKRSRLYGIKSPYVLIYFNNPGCGDCKRVGGLLKESRIISSLIQEKKLSLLSLYPDEDKKLWKKNSSLVPSEWINACDPKTVIKKKVLYDLKAIPSLYLLDSNKRVILKDVYFEELEKYLGQHS